MKEVTYEDWQKNPTPRVMWVWDEDEIDKEQRKVIYFLDPKITYPIIALDSDETSTEKFKYCAEIEKQRRMTKKELSGWLSEKPRREYSHLNEGWVYPYYSYPEEEQDETVSSGIHIRENYGKWREPLVEE